MKQTTIQIGETVYEINCFDNEYAIVYKDNNGAKQSIPINNDLVLEMWFKDQLSNVLWTKINKSN